MYFLCILKNAIHIVDKNDIIKLFSDYPDIKY